MIELQSVNSISSCVSLCAHCTCWPWISSDDVQGDYGDGVGLRGVYDILATQAGCCSAVVSCRICLWAKSYGVALICDLRIAKAVWRAAACCREQYCKITLVDASVSHMSLDLPAVGIACEPHERYFDVLEGVSLSSSLSFSLYLYPSWMNERTCWANERTNVK